MIDTIIVYTVFWVTLIVTAMFSLVYVGWFIWKLISPLPTYTKWKEDEEE